MEIRNTKHLATISNNKSKGSFKKKISFISMASLSMILDNRAKRSLMLKTSTGFRTDETFTNFTECSWIDQNKRMQSQVADLRVKE